ncbi:MAG TPA: calcineurin-like phosphoesterase C-terminal domain-containing protein, partial [Chitinophagaceae bacterium]
SRGSLEQFEGFDPLAYSTMLGPDLPKPRGFAEPKKTDHLFKAMIPATAKEVQVIVTDRFGKKYSSSHQV